jgi:hypothetical protein
MFERRSALPSPRGFRCQLGFPLTSECHCGLDAGFEDGALSFKCSGHRGALCRANLKAYGGREVVNAHWL